MGLRGLAMEYGRLLPPGERSPWRDGRKRPSGSSCGKTKLVSRVGEMTISSGSRRSRDRDLDLERSRMLPSLTESDIFFVREGVSAFVT